MQTYRSNHEKIRRKHMELFALRKKSGQNDDTRRSVMKEIDMYRAFSSLDDVRIPEDKKHDIWEILEKAIQAPKPQRLQRRKRRYVFAAASTATLAALVAGVVFLPFLLNNNHSVESVPATGTQTTASVAEITTPERRVVYGNPSMIEEAIPPIGIYLLSGGVSEAIKDPLNASALFYVTTIVYYGNKLTVLESFVYEGKTISEWAEDPALNEYRDGFDAFSLEKYNEIDWDSIETSEEKESVLLGIVEEWDALWDATHSANPSKDLAKAEQAFEIEKNQEIFSLLSAEADRLMSLGLDVTLEGTADSRPRLVAYLSKEQIENFPCGEYGYYIAWADKEDVMEE